MCEFFSITSALFALCIQLTAHGGVQTDPFASDSFQSGINVYLTEQDVVATDNYVATVQSFLDRIEPEINSVSIVWPIYTQGRRSSVIETGEKTPSLEAIATFSAIAKARGFGVVLHPVLDEDSIALPGSRHWRGSIDPWQVDRWFTEYTQLMVSYGLVAAQTGVDAVVIGAELTSMEQHEEEWRKVSAAVREVYPNGLLTYASNREISQEFPWDAVDFIGVDAFFALSVSADATVEEMIFELEKDLLGIRADAAKLGMPLVFTEVGTTSQRGSFQRSWVWDHESATDLEAQARYYEAVCQVWKDELQGLYWWVTGLYQIPDDQLSDDGYFDPMGKPAEAVIRSCFTRT